jgi:hypothetical protein
MSSPKLLCAVALALVTTSACCRCDRDATARGNVAAVWSITAFGEPTTCAHVGAATVSVLLHSRDGGNDAAFSFPCADAKATAAVAAGAYEATLSLRAVDGAPLSTAPVQAKVTIGAGQLVTLAPVTLVVFDRSRLVIALSALGTLANCTSASQGGADLSGSEITLLRAEGGCEPVTFTRSRAGVTLGTYTVNCSAPTVAPCIERDELLTVDAIGSGPYAIRVRGYRGPVPSLFGADVLSVPAGTTLTQTIQLAPFVAR